MKKTGLIIMLVLLINQLTAQLKTLPATRINNPVKLDGMLDDAAWQTAVAATDFITNTPTFGLPASQPATVKILYDDVAIYVGAYLKDNPAKIRKQLTARDEHLRKDVDYFAFFIDTYKDRQNGFQFLVTSRNVQTDARLSSTFETNFGEYGDLSWDAVWDSRVNIGKDGWSVEMKIPYSAIRFTGTNVQEWGLQLLRFSRANNETSFWNPVNPAVNGFVNQFGNLTDLQGIMPPLRLSFSPYVSGGYRSSPEDANGNRNKQFLKSGGMDVKWGVNESFTLDATLIPDFGQVISDNVVNNLTPFDIQFKENRPFFTEGTELFNKAGIFYSRRVGRTPGGYNNVEDLVQNNNQYKVIDNPSVVPLYNAIKFSGRNKHNVGIGVFNALSRPVKAKVRNNVTGVDSVINTEALTNYNIVVVDKAFKNRSYITFTNTNVVRNGSSGQDANVTAIDVALYNKTNRYGLFISPRYSKIFGNTVYDGFANASSFGKISGNWQWQVANNIESDKYNPNDLGFLEAPNEITTSGSISYNIFMPVKKLLNQRYEFYAAQSYLYKPLSYQKYEFEFNTDWTFKNFWDLHLNLSTIPVKSYDYFELRTNFKKLRKASFFYTGLFGSSDSRKRLYVSWNAGFAESQEIYNDLYWRLKLSARYRFSDRLSMELSVSAQNDNGQFGYAFERESNGEPILARRKYYDVTTLLSGIYNFTPRMNITMRARHYWNKVTNTNFYNVDDKGDWFYRPFINGGDLNVNIFNVDVFYVWDFRLGSRIVIGYKNWIDPNYTNNITTRPDYGKNFSNLFNISHGNEVTLRFIYYLDYLQLKKKNRSKTIQSNP
jgi:Domain of unknown function (DUF5916)/Carbohydrate family 9 binding domain-like